MKEKRIRIEEIYNLLPGFVTSYIDKLPKEKFAELREIRIRVNQPVTLVFSCDTAVISSVVCRKSDLELTFAKLCKYSPYSYHEEIKNGFITLKYGHRAGFAGTAIYDDKNNIVSFKNISSINFRIASEIKGCASDLYNVILHKNTIVGALIISPPACGKTTILRDIARALSYKRFNTVIADERSEIAACYNGVIYNDLGPCCDVIDGAKKPKAIEIALKCLSPDVIICDEIGSKEEIIGITAMLNAGVPVIATAHASTLSELLKREQFMPLFTSGAICKVIELYTEERPGMIRKIYTRGEINAKIRRLVNISSAYDVSTL